MNQRIVIFTAGSLSGDFLKELKSTDFLIGVDKAALWLIKNKIVPNLAIGDFDSLTLEELNFLKKQVKDINQYPPEKDLTDLNLALNYALSRKPGQIIIFGGTGTRLDHTLGNIFLLDLCLKKNVPAKICDNNNELFLANRSLTLPKSPIYRYLSILSLTKSSAISLTGFKYEALHKKIEFDQPIGISNEIVDSVCKIDIHKGTVLIILSRD